METELGLSLIVAASCVLVALYVATLGSYGQNHRR